MSFGEELRIAKDEYAIATWECIKPYLKDISYLRGEPGCSIHFGNIPSAIIKKIGEIAELEDIRFGYWTVGSKEHPGGDSDIGMLAWDIDTFLSMYPLKVSPTILFVSRNAEGEPEITVSE